MEKLDNDYLGSAKLAYKEWECVVDKYTSRINYVIREICRLFKTNLDWWDYPEGHLAMHRIDSEIIQLDGKIYGRDMIALIYGYKWNFSNLEFPSKFLYSDFEDELFVGIQNYKEFKEIEKLKKSEKIKSDVLKTKALIKSAKSKLTKSELNALKSMMN